MAQDPAQPADGQQKKLPHTGELIITKDGKVLMVLGTPQLSTVVGMESMRHFLRDSVVVLTPDGIPALHVMDTGAGRAPFIHPWEWGWTPIDGTNDTQPPPPRPRSRKPR